MLVYVCWLELSEDVLILYTPLLCEMEDSSSTLNLEEFIDASERLLLSLSLSQQNTLVSFYKKSAKRESVGRSESFNSFSFKVWTHLIILMCVATNKSKIARVECKEEEFGC